MVLQRFSDPRFGETTYRLVNVVLGDPSPDLFQVPQGYELKAPEMPRAGVRVAPGAPGEAVQFRAPADRAGAGAVRLTGRGLAARARLDRDERVDDEPFARRRPVAGSDEVPFDGRQRDLAARVHAPVLAPELANAPASATGNVRPVKHSLNVAPVVASRRSRRRA